jgi:hypothetical protein
MTELWSRKVINIQTPIQNNQKKKENRIFIYFIKAPVIKCITDRLTQMDPTPREGEQPIEGTSGDTEIRWCLLLGTRGDR